MDSLSLFAAMIGLLVGVLMVWLVTRNRTSGASDQGQAERAVELATARERLSALDAERLQLIRAHEELKVQVIELRDTLDDVCSERAQLSERALRVPVLEHKLAEVERILAETRQQAANLREDSGRGTPAVSMQNSGPNVRPSVRSAANCRAKRHSGQRPSCAPIVLTANSPS